jgi:hypothetical protein
MRIVTYLIEYLGKFKFIFKTILDYESGDQMGSFEAKKTPSKTSCLGTFNADFLPSFLHLFFPDLKGLFARTPVKWIYLFLEVIWQLFEVN